MSTPESRSPVAHPPEQPPAGPPATPLDPAVAPDGQAPKKHRNRWVWVSAGLALVAVGLLVWGLDSRSDLRSAQDDAAAQQAQADKAKETGNSVVDSAKSAYADLQQQLGLTNESLEDTQSDLDSAEKQAASAQQDAAKAQDDAEQAKSETDKANAQADVAKAQADAAQSKARIATDCAKESVSAIGTLFEGDNVSAQAQAVKDRLSGIAADCKAALTGP
jgi:hypothetical protein